MSDLRESVKRDNLRNIHENYFRRILHPDKGHELSLGVFSIFCTVIFCLWLAHALLPAVK